MKRFFALAALVLGLASCQTEPEGLDVQMGGEVDTTITVNIPDSETRAGGTNSAGSIFDNVDLSGDATIRYILKIYQKVGNEYVASNDRQVEYSDDKSVVFSVRLVPNRDYRFVVWADYVVSEDDEDYHYNTEDLTNITLKADTWVAMDETRDAFTGVYCTVEAGKQYTGTSSINILLKRPFAKLRVVTTDIKELTDLHITPAYATVAYTTEYRPAFNALAGTAKAVGTVKKAHSTVFPIAPYTNEANDTHNRTIFTDYFFANEGDAVSFILDVYEDEAKTKPIKSNNFNTDIAVNRNYLTTISGNILTDGNNVKVDIQDAFENADNLEDEPYYVEIWDGESIEKPELVTDPTTGEDYYSVENGSELAWLAAVVNGTLPANTYATRADNNNFAGMSFKLTQDIDLGGNAWTPISMSTDLAGGKTFRGTFDGNGHTIKGLYVRNQEVAGLFGYVYAATIKNVTIEGANLNSNHYAGGVVAWVLNTKGNIKVPFVMENCHVKNSTIVSTPALINGEWDNGDKVGGLVGYAEIDNDGAEIKDCSVKNTSIKAYRDFGGLFGYAKGVAINNYTIENISLEQDLSHDYKAPNTPNTFGMIIGRNEGGNTINGGDYSYEAVANGVYTLNDNYHIFNAKGLQWVSENVNTMEYYVNQSANIFDGKTVYLDNDIDLGGAEWRPIGDYAFSRTSFNGIFDGQGYTVSNFKVTNKVAWSEKVTEASYGFFGNVKGSIKNLTIENATIAPEGGRYSAALVGRLHNGGRIDNCHVVNSSVTISHWQIGGLVGQNNNGNISGCSVVGSTITGYAAVGAIVGMDMIAGTHTIENCRVANSALVQNGSFGASYDASYGLAVGLVNVSDIVLNIKDVVAENNTIKGVADNTLVGDIENGATVTINGVSIVTTPEQLEVALKAGGHIVLVNNIALTKSIAISNANFTLNGNGYTITMAEGATNTYALFDITGGKAAIKNVTFDGIKEGGVIRTVGVEFTAENVVAKNGQHTQEQGLFRLLGKSTITNCTFKNNTCNMVITLNYDGANNDPQVVENCVFEGNTCNFTAVLYYVKGASATINGNKFIGNTVNCSGNGATIYMGFTENNVVTNNLFQNNTVNEAAESSRVAGGVFFGYETVFTGNAFVGNKVTGTNAKGNDVCVSTYYTSIDLSGNYWGGSAPVEDTNYFVQHKSDERVVTVNDYLTVNPFN